MASYKHKTGTYVLLLLTCLTVFTCCSKDKDEDVVHAVGETYQGGTIAYILQTGDPGYDAGKQHGIIVASTDQNGGADMAWGPASASYAGGSGTTLGTGMTNTNNIVNKLSGTATAALVCYDLNLNGHDDWYLPSQAELLKVLQNIASLGEFKGARYWTSTESAMDPQQAVVIRFPDGSIINQTKTVANRVRAVRSF